MGTHVRTHASTHIHIPTHTCPPYSPTPPNEHGHCVHLHGSPLGRVHQRRRPRRNQLASPPWSWREGHLAAEPAPLTTNAAELRTKSRGIEPRGAADQRGPLVLTKHLWPAPRGDRGSCRSNVYSNVWASKPYLKYQGSPATGTRGTAKGWAEGCGESCLTSVPLTSVPESDGVRACSRREKGGARARRR